MKLRKIAASVVSAVLLAVSLHTFSDTDRYVPVDIQAANTSYSLGDVNNDSQINSKDASEILSEYASLSTGGKASFDEEKRLRADVTLDKSIDSKDASLILAYYAYTSTGGKESLERYKQLPPETTTTRTTTATTTKATTTTTKAYVEYHFRSQKLLNEHFAKHGSEFPSSFSYTTAEKYEHGASNVINSPTALHKTEKDDGDFVYYIEATNEFVVLSTDGYIRTYFLPSAGKSYYDRQ